MAIQTFNRKEVKYLLTPQQSAGITRALAGHLVPDDYGRSSYTSIYYDTEDFHLLERSLDKPLYKEKIRVRYYGDLRDASQKVFVEIKKKHKGIVYKRRVALSYAGACAMLEGESFDRATECFPVDGKPQKPADAVTSQIAREIETMCRRYGRLVPQIAVRYSRVAYKPVDAETNDWGEPLELRITFDTQLEYGVLDGENWVFQPLISSDTAVMEIKNQGPYPLWFVHALSHNDIHPASFSKVGTAYRFLIAQNHGGHEK